MKSGYLIAVSADGHEQLKQPLPDAWTKEGIRERLSPDHKKIIRIRDRWLIKAAQDSLIGTAAIMDLEQKIFVTIPDGNECFGYSAGSWSPDGTRLVIACKEKLEMISFPSKDMTMLYVGCGVICLNVQWSPDGKWLSFSSLETGTPSSAPDLFVVNTEDCLNDPYHCFEKRRGPFRTHMDYSIDYREWSPDGKYLLVPAVGTNDNLKLEFINIQNGQTERTIQIPGADYSGRIRGFAWSPDGKQIAFFQINNEVPPPADQKSPPADGIYLIPAVGGTPVWIADSPKYWPPIFQWISIPHPFTPGVKYTITPAGNGLNLRDQPSQAGKPLKVLKAGDEITIVKGPILADGYTWWQMRTKDGVEGWAEDLPDWYAKE
jgi:Tol biopolymer transport system component